MKKHLMKKLNMKRKTWRTKSGLNETEPEDNLKLILIKGSEHKNRKELLKKVYSRRGQKLYLQNKNFNGRSQKATATEQSRIYSYRKKNALIQLMSTQI